MRNYFSSKINRLAVVLVGVLLSVGQVYAGGSSYSGGRVFLKEGSPTTGAGKVYVSTSSSASESSYKDCTSSTTAASQATTKGASTTTKYYFFAKANPGYKFTGWYKKNYSDEYELKTTSTTYSENVTSAGTPYVNSTSYTWADLYAGFIKAIQMSFVTPTNGSFTVSHNGSTVTPAYSSFTTDGPVVLTATPAAGYKFRGWYTTTDGGVSKSYFAFATKCEANQFTSDVTIGAEFVPEDGKATFWPKGSKKVYDDLTTALAATSSGGVCVVVGDGVLPAGNYTIPANKTLYIPYSASSTTSGKTTEPHIVHIPRATNAPAISAYRRLTLASGANLTVNGVLSLGGQLASSNGGTGASSVPYGPSGVLDLSQGGTVTLASGSTLYAFGFVKGQNMNEGDNTSGVGHIIAQSGSQVWEDFQVGDWRGGTATSTIYKTTFFPFQSWTIQNIEAPIEYQAGSTGSCYWTIYGDGNINTVTFSYVKSSDALFKLASGGSLSKWYDPTKDVMNYQLNGAAQMDAMVITAMGTTMNTSSYYLPMPSNMRIILASGNTVTVSNKIVQHPGSVIEIQSGAHLIVNTEICLYDKDDWGQYCQSGYFGKFNTISTHYDRGAITSNANLEDATIIVDGNMTVKSSSGKVYSSAKSNNSGSRIMGHHNAWIRYEGSLPSGTKTMQQYTSTSTSVSDKIASANLYNENGTYTQALSGSYFDNVHGRWFKRNKKDPLADHTWEFTYIKDGKPKTGTASDASTTTRAVYSHTTAGTMKWSNVVSDECENWWKGVGTESSYYFNWTMESAWHQLVPSEGAIYLGSNDRLYKKNAVDPCIWENPEGYEYADCKYTIGGVTKILVGGVFYAISPNTEDAAWHLSSSATSYYICLDGCKWHPAVKTPKPTSGTYEKAYTTTDESKKYIWYNDMWVEAEERAPYFWGRVDDHLMCFEYVSGAWTPVSPMAEIQTAYGISNLYSVQDLQDSINRNIASTVRLRKALTLTAPLTYTGDNTCTFDLNGFVLSGNINDLLTINASGASSLFILVDGAGTGKIDATRSYNGRVNAVSVLNGHLMVNSGFVYAENTRSGSPATAINVAKGKKLTINGDSIKAVSSGETWAIHTDNNSNTTSLVTINGGLVRGETTATGEVNVRGIHSEGGRVVQNGGRVEAHAPAGNTGNTIAVRLDNGAGRYEINGGTAYVHADTKAYALYLNSNNAIATLNSGTMEAHAMSASAYTLSSGGQVTINEGMILKADAASGARAISTSGATHKTWVNGGKFYARTLTGNNACGLYASKGTDTINGGEFYVTAFAQDAYGVYAANDASAIVVVNGGKFMIHDADSAGTSKSYCCGTAGTTANMKIAGGYYNIDRNLDTYKISGKNKKPITSESNPDLYAQGYNWKVVNDEYTVTFKHSLTDEVLQSGLVESTKVPVYSGPDVTADYYDAVNDATYAFLGWSTVKNGTPAPLAPVGGSSVTYWAVYSKIYADVTISGTTTRYDDTNGGVAAAWNAALGATQAVVKIVSSVDNLGRLTEWKDKTAKIITLDLNGHHWGMNGEVDADKTEFIAVNQPGVKLIITDNSAAGNGYIHAGWTGEWIPSAELRCVLARNGELLLERGSIKCNNPSATSAANAVTMWNTNLFTMTGGSLEAKKEGASVTGGRAIGLSMANGTIDIAGGLIKATNTSAAGDARGINIADGTAALGDTLNVVVRATKNAYGVYTCGTVTVNGASIDVKSNTSDAHGIYNYKGSKAGELTIHDADMSVQVCGSDASAVYGSDNSVTTIEDGTFKVFTDTVTTTRYYRVDILRNTGNGAKMFISGGTYDVQNSSRSGTSKGEGYIMRTAGDSVVFSGHPKFTSNSFGIWAGYANNKSTDAKATVIIDGGEFISDKYVLRSDNTSYASGDIHILDGKCKVITSNLIRFDDPYTPVENLQIKGGYFSSDAAGRLSVYDATTNPTGYVRSPSYVQAGDYGDGYTHHVVNVHTISWEWSDGENSGTLRAPDEVEHNVLPIYGPEDPVHPASTNTYAFIGWDKPITIAKEDVTYTALFAKVEAEVTMNKDASGVMFEHFSEAWAYALDAERKDAIIRLLSDVTSTAVYTYDVASANILDLNSHTFTYTGSATDVFTVNNASAKFTITDYSESHTGEIHYESAYTNGKNPFQLINIAHGELELAGGKLYAENTSTAYTSGSVTPKVYAVNVADAADAKFTMTNGEIVAKKTTGDGAYGVYTKGISTISGGSILAIADNSTRAALAYGIAIEGRTLTVSDSACVKDSTNYGATAALLINAATAECNVYGGTFLTVTTATGAQDNVSVIRLSNGSCTVEGGDFTVLNRSSNDARIIQAEKGTLSISGNPVFRGDIGIYKYNKTNATSVTVNGGTFEVAKKLFAKVESLTTTVNGGKFKCNTTNIAFNSNGGGGTLSINGGYFNEVSGTSTKTALAALVPVANIFDLGSEDEGERDPAYPEYRWLITNGSPVAKVLYGTERTYHSTLQAAIDTAETRNHSTISLLENISQTTTLEFAPAEEDTCTFDLHGRTVVYTGTGKTCLIINGPQSKMTITDSKTGGQMRYSQAYTDTFSLVSISKGELELANGMLYAQNTSAASSARVFGVAVGSRNDAFFTMNEGEIEVSLPSSSCAYGIESRGITTVNGGAIRASALSTAIGIHVAARSTTVNGNDSVRTDVSNGSSQAILIAGTAATECTVNGGRFVVEQATNTEESMNNVDGYRIQGGGKFTVTGGDLYVYNKSKGTSTAIRPEMGAFFISGDPTFTADNGVYKYNQTVDSERTDTAWVKIDGGTFNCGTFLNCSRQYWTVTVTNVKAKGNPVPATVPATNVSIAIAGGYFEKATNNVSNYLAPNKLLKPMTAAEKALPGLADYNYKVVDGTETGFYADIIDANKSTGKLLLNVADWAAANWPYTINEIEYPLSARSNKRTLEVPYIGSPGEEFILSIKKNDGTLVSQHVYIVPEVATSWMNFRWNVNYSIYVKGTTLVMNGDATVKNIYVDTLATLRVNEGMTLTADTIFLRTSSRAAAKLENNGTIAPSTQLVYTRIESSNARSFQFGLPLSCPISAVRLSNGQIPAYKGSTGWILRYYDEEKRATEGAGSNWKTLDAAGTIESGKGYELYSGVKYYREFYFPVDISALTNQVAVTHHDGAPTDAGWNTLVSPLTYKLTLTPAPEDMPVSWMELDGTFKQENPKSIPPVKLFAYQAANSGYITFGASSITPPSLAPRRVKAAEESVQIQWINLDITDANGETDQTSIYSHPTRYDAVYQTGIDVAKLSFEASRALLYSSHTYGDMAFAGVADSLLEQGVALTVFSPQPQELTISMSENEWLERLAEVWLIDTETGAQIDLLDSDYSFEANEGTTRGRLFLQGRFKAPQITTDIGNTDADGNSVKAQKIIIKDKLYIRINNQLYDATGKQVK